MLTSSASESYYSNHEEIAFVRERKRDRESYVEEVPWARKTYLFRLGCEPIKLTFIEFCIIDFLAQKPYKAYTRKQIVESIRSSRCVVTEKTLDDCIRSLRDKLGIFSDFIQSVPYIGYRFKP